MPLIAKNNEPITPVAVPVLPHVEFPQNTGNGKIGEKGRSNKKAQSPGGCDKRF